MRVDLFIEHEGKIYMPSLLEGMTLETHRRGSPATLTFTALGDEILKFNSATNVKLQVDGKKMFNGFVFSRRWGKEKHIQVMALDQTRYFKASGIKNFRNVAAGDVVREIAQDLQNIRIGDVSGPKFRVKNHLDENISFFDMIHNALAREWMNTGNLYTFFDDFGELTLKSLDEMTTDLLVDNTTAKDFEFSATIDDRTYNKVVLVRKNKDKNRDWYVEQSSDSINKWGTLVYFETLNGDEDGREKAKVLLNLFNAETRTMSVSDNFGDLRIRGGSKVFCNIDMGMEKVNHQMVVDRCLHKFNHGEHFMDLDLIGGAIA